MSRIVFVSKIDYLVNHLHILLQLPVELPLPDLIPIQPLLQGHIVLKECRPCDRCHTLLGVLMDGAEVLERGFVDQRFKTADNFLEVLCFILQVIHGFFIGPVLLWEFLH